MKILTSKIAILALSFLPMFGFQSASAIEGVAIGIGYQESAYYGVGEESSTSSGDNTAKKITKEAGAFTASAPVVFIEVAANDKVSLGLEHVTEDIDTPTNVNMQETTQNTVSATFTDHYTLYANISMPFNTYLKAGYIMADVVTTESLGTGGAYPNVDTTGLTVGLGYHHDLDNGVFFRAEVAVAEYDDVTATNSNEADKVVTVADMMSATAQIKIGKSF